MKKITAISQATFFIFTTLLVMFAMCQNAHCINRDTNRIVLSIPNFHIDQKDRIKEMKATVVNGFIVSVPRIPPGWSFHIDLPRQWKTEIVAGSIVGVADLTVDDINYFNDFLVVEYTGHQDEELKIDINIKIDNGNGNERILHFNMKDLMIKKIKTNETTHK